MLLKLETQIQDIRCHHSVQVSTLNCCETNLESSVKTHLEYCVQMAINWDKMLQNGRLAH